MSSCRGWLPYRQLRIAHGPPGWGWVEGRASVRARGNATSESSHHRRRLAHGCMTNCQVVLLVSIARPVAFHGWYVDRHDWKRRENEVSLRRGPAAPPKVAGGLMQ